MEPVPPPHERSWRHPSELAPPPLEETPRRVRIVAAVTGAASVALVGLFALTVTPSNSAVVVSSSTLTPSATALSASTSSATFDEQTTSSESDAGDDRPATDEENVVVFVDASATITTSVDTDPRGFPMATVRFSSRLSTRGILIDVIGDIAVVELDPSRPQDRRLVEKLELPEYVVASSVPHEAARVTAMSRSPQEVRLGDVDDLQLEPGTAVVDEDNRLIAICDEHGDIEVVATDPLPVTSTTEEPGITEPPSTTGAPPPTTLPDTTSTTTPDTGTTPPSTTLPSSSASTEPDTTPSTTAAESSTPDEPSTPDDSSTSDDSSTTTRKTSPPSDGSTTASAADAKNDGSD